MSPDSTPPLEDSEDLGRGVYSEKYARRARNGTVPHRVFLERLGAPSISVDRMSRAPKAQLAAVSEERGRGRTPPQRFRGWAVVKAGDARMNGRTVEATPLPGNPHHADIYLNLPWGLSEDERSLVQKEHANELATLALWMGA